jgi:undecaprenyl-diphosphatase
MGIFIIIILAIIQGITEFLPISSSGHLVLFYKIFNITENRILLSIVLHLGTLFSVIMYYRKSLIKLIKKPLCHTNLMLILSTIITCIIAIIFKNKIEGSFNGKFLGSVAPDGKVFDLNKNVVGNLYAN